jgi:hypothetical protein
MKDHKCAVKNCPNRAVTGSIVKGTKDVLLELCEYHRNQFTDLRDNTDTDEEFDSEYNDGECDDE